LPQRTWVPAIVLVSGLLITVFAAWMVNAYLVRAEVAEATVAGDHAAAARYYEKALALAPYSMNLRYDLARTYENFDKGKAAALYRELLEMSKTNPGITMEKLEDAQKRYAALAREGYHG